MLALPASQKPRTISSSQLCQNTALRASRTQTRLEQQTPSAHSSSQNLQLLPQLSQGREEPARRVILVGWAASTAPFRRNWASTLPWGSVCSLQGWRGSTQGRKCLSEAQEHVKWKNLAEDSAVRSNVFLAEGGAIQRWKVKFDHVMQQLLPSLLILASWTVLFLQTCAGSSWLLAAHQCTKYKTQLIQFFPTANQAEHSKQQLPSRPHCTLTCLTFSTIPKKPQKRFLLLPDWCLEWHYPLSQSLIYTMFVTKDIVFIDLQYRMIKQQFHNQHFFVQGNEIVFPVQYVNTEI